MESTQNQEARLLIVDDEPDSRALIRSYLSRYFPTVHDIREASGVMDAHAMLQQQPADLLLLDVQMDDGTGFDLLDRCAPWNFHVIFITSHDDFAVRAFRYHAIDYLLKPMVPEEFVEALTRILSSNNNHSKEQISGLLDTKASGKFDRITLNTGNGLVFTRTNEILRLETYGNYSFVFLTNGERHLVPRNLKEYEEILPAPMFFRVHQSHLINVSLVRKFVKEDGGSAVMNDDSQVPVSRRRKEDLLGLLKNATRSKR